LSPGSNTVRLPCVNRRRSARAQHAALTLAAAEAERVVTVSCFSPDGAVLQPFAGPGNGVEVVYRRAGDAYVLIDW
jgi:hypothetical protein